MTTNLLAFTVEPVSLPAMQLVTSSPSCVGSSTARIETPDVRVDGDNLKSRHSDEVYFRAGIDLRRSDRERVPGVLYLSVACHGKAGQYRIESVSPNGRSACSN